MEIQPWECISDREFRNIAESSGIADHLRGEPGIHKCRMTRWMCQPDCGNRIPFFCTIMTMIIYIVVCGRVWIDPAESEITFSFSFESWWKGKRWNEGEFYNIYKCVGWCWWILSIDFCYFRKFGWLQKYIKYLKFFF